MALPESLLCDGDLECLTHALESRTSFSTPYPHSLLTKLFDEDLVEDLLAIPFTPQARSYDVGTREQHNDARQYFSPDIIDVYSAAKRVSYLFRSQSIIDKLENIGGVSLKDTLLRVEYALDTDVFWLKPHTDLGVKIVTILIYLSPGSQSENWGTDIYADADTYVKTAPYKSNTALLFFPSSATWHGFEPRNINGIRKTLIVNYVTQEWRNRQELTHPTEAVY